MKTRYALIALGVAIVIIGGGVVLAGINLEAPTKSVEKVIPNDRFAR